MIRPLNINKDAHTADFVCDDHAGTATGINLNAQCNYADSGAGITINGDLLTPLCGCVTYHPTVGGNELAQQLAEAKTA